MKGLLNYISFLLILVLGSNSIISGFSGPKDKELSSFEQDMLSDSQVDVHFNYFVDASSEKIIIPSFKAKHFDFNGSGIKLNQISGILESGSLRLDWFKRKERFFDVQKLLYPFHFFL
ncbi:hypothetical protein [Aquiflexum balticum]|uniref:hypothetical protein n=1 Tax=Aquiflexum balticum TaxID=280473 RepID=UPI000A023323|nr:hypothetical protein [Aquiflexum balticum]